MTVTEFTVMPAPKSRRRAVDEVRELTGDVQVQPLGLSPGRRRHGRDRGQPASTVKPFARSATSPSVVAVTVRAPSAAQGRIAMFSVALVGLLMTSEVT